MKETRFKQTEIGLVPEEWEVVPIEDLFQIGNGYTPSKAIPEYWNHGTLPWFRMEDIRLNGRILKDSIQHITPQAIKGSGLFPAYSIIISTTATIGEHALLIADSLANQQFTFLWNVNRCYSVDMYYAFYHCFLLGEWCRNNINFGGLTAVNMNAFKKYPFPLPPLPEQRKIAEALGDIDALIAGLDKLIAKKRLIKQGAMQQLLTGRTRLKGFNQPWKTACIGSDTYVKARIGWQGLTTNEYLDNGKYNLVGGIDFKDGKVDWKHCFYVSEWRFKQDRNIQLKDGDVLISKDGTIGKVAYVNVLPKPATLNSGVFVIRSKKEILRQEYLALVFLSPLFKDFVDELVAGSTIQHLYQKDIIKFSFSIPSTTSEQHAIASILTDMDNEITELEKKKSKYEKLKQGMMQQLLTGRIRLI